jgi:hypothetical protein
MFLINKVIKQKMNIYKHLKNSKNKLKNQKLIHEDE